MFIKILYVQWMNKLEGIFPQECSIDFDVSKCRAEDWDAVRTFVLFLLSIAEAL